MNPFYSCHKREEVEKLSSVCCSDANGHPLVVSIRSLNMIHPLEPWICMLNHNLP